MKQSKVLLIICIVCIALAGYSQTENNSKDLPYIEVTGTAKLEIVPDEIYIRITIRERYANKEKITIEDQEARLKTALKGIGVPIENLYLSDANADFTKIRWLKKDVITQKDYTLKVADAATLGKVFTELEKLDITDAGIELVDHSKMDSLKRAVKIEAIKAAKTKADYLLNAIGEKAGKPLIVREEEVRPYSINRGMYANVRMNEDKWGGMDIADDLQFSKIKIETSIYVKFLIL